MPPRVDNPDIYIRGGHLLAPNQRAAISLPFIELTPPMVHRSSARALSDQ